MIQYLLWELSVQTDVNILIMVIFSPTHQTRYVVVYWDLVQESQVLYSISSSPQKCICSSVQRAVSTPQHPRLSSLRLKFATEVVSMWMQKPMGACMYMVVCGQLLWICTFIYDPILSFKKPAKHITTGESQKVHQLELQLQAQLHLHNYGSIRSLHCWCSIGPPVVSSYFISQGSESLPSWRERSTGLPLPHSWWCCLSSLVLYILRKLLQWRSGLMKPAELHHQQNRSNPDASML